MKEHAQYVAHISEDGKRTESVYQHLTEVANMASRFAGQFGHADWGYAAGMLHDLGKYSEQFQNRVLRNGPKVDHATAGAYVAATSCRSLLSYCIAGHHSGLPDGGVMGDVESTLCGRIYKAQHALIPDFDAYKTEVEIPSVTSAPATIDPSRCEDPTYVHGVRYSVAFLTRMVFSCLVDADYLCTERFMLNMERRPPQTLQLAQMRDLLEKRLAAFFPPSNRLNALRCGVLEDCKRAAAATPGVFSLTVPTGGGKTYALMRFALQHATQEGRQFDRVICAEPYTSIIEQNAAVYREVFGDSNVLEHHSNYDFGGGEGDGTSRDCMRLAAENWDVPLIVTTNVQLFESLYANRPSRCRKLHNIARSVIVLDEAQMIPVKYLRPCVAALAELVKHYGCTVVLCTATQPALSELFSEMGLQVHEIASHPEDLVQDLQRVRYVSHGPLTDDSLARLIALHEQSLCVVNNRKQARMLYDMLVALMSSEQQGSVFHLSTLMTPAHRLRVLEVIRARMDRGLACRVVSTSLIEAGVDLDFEVVFRAVAGVDSMVQAAGRCNREMRRPAEDSVVHLFESAEGYAVPAEVAQCAEVSRSILPSLRTESEVAAIDSLEVVGQYFTRLYDNKVLDDKHIVEQLSSYGQSGVFPSIPYATTAAQFRMIDDGSFAVVIPDPSCDHDVKRLCEGDITRGVMRRLSRHSVNIYQADRDALLRAGAIACVGEDTFLLEERSRYSEEYGLDLYARGGDAVFL